MFDATSRRPGTAAWPGWSAIAFLACIPLSNFLLSHVGTVRAPGGPWLIPVWPGLLAPSGVVAVGLALVLRDAVHEAGGPRWVFGALLCGGLLSAVVAPSSLAVASVVAFGISEGADWAVYRPLRQRGRLLAAVFASGAVGTLVDSVVFLWLAFGRLEHLCGQVVGKLMATVVLVIILYLKGRLWGSPSTSART